MHRVLGQKKKTKEKKNVCAVVETFFFHFETCECAVMIKETRKLHFQYRTKNGGHIFVPIQGSSDNSRSCTLSGCTG